MVKPFGIIYKITNSKTNMIYIGQTTNKMTVRWSDHCKPSNKSCSYLKNAINHYKRDSFIIEELASTWNIDNLNFLEKYFINYFNCVAPFGYNLTLGGDSYIRSEIACLNISKALKGKKKRPKTDEEKLHLSLILKGRKKSKQFCEQLSKIKTGVPLPKNNVVTSKSIISINLITNEQILYPSIAEADRSGFNYMCLNQALKKDDLVYKNCLWFYSNKFTLEHIEKKKEAVIIKMSKIKGIYFHKRDNLWLSKIKINNKTKNLGYFKKKEDAIICYRIALLNKLVFLRSLILQRGWR